MARPAPPTLLFDIHGVLLGREEPAGHLPPGDVLSALRRAGYPLRFLTNSSSVSQQMLVEQLERAGIGVEVEEVYTAAMTVAHYLRASTVPRRLYLIGSDGLRAEIDKVCGARVAWVQPEQADTVVISRAPSPNLTLLARLAQVPELRLIATCRDEFFPDGAEVSTGPGATVQLVEHALDRQALVLGKPNTYALTEVMGMGQEALANIVVIGDSLAQDIALCQRISARSVLVLNESSAERKGHATQQAMRPDHSICALDQLFSILEVGVA